MANEQRFVSRWLTDAEQSKYERDLSAAKSPDMRREVEQSRRELEGERQHDASWNSHERKYYEFDRGYETNDSLMRHSDFADKLLAEARDVLKREGLDGRGMPLDQDRDDRQRGERTR